MRILSRARFVHATTAVAVLGVGVLLLAPISFWLAVAELLADLFGWQWAPGLEEDPPALGVDKVVHFALFFLLSWQVSRSWRLISRDSLWLAWAGCGAYGAALEVLQARTGRTGDLLDVVADVLGVLGFVGWSYVLSRSESSS